MSAVLGVDIGGTNLRAALVAGDGTVAGFASRRWSGGEPERAVAGVVDLAGELAGSASGAAPAACGCGCAGLVDRALGIVRRSPNLPTWRDVELAKAVSSALGLPTVLENDANAAAYAEYVLGAARGAENALALTLGTGVGGGLVFGGRVYRGSHGTAGEIGHAVLDLDGPPCACGSSGCVERLVNAEAIVERAGALLAAGRDSSLAAVASARPLTAADVGEAAGAGDAVAREVIEETGRILGIALASLTNVLDPDVIVIGGGIVGAGELLLRPAREAMAGRLYGRAFRTPRVVPAELGDRAGAIGAALLAREAAE